MRIKIAKLFIIVIASVMFLVACGDDGEKSSIEKSHIVSVTKKVISKHLPYSGVVKPKTEVLVLSPEEGVMKSIHVAYGQSVKKGDVLFVIQSDKFQQAFSVALSTYLKSKDQFNQSKVKLDGSEALFSDGLISKNEIEADRSTYYSNNLALLQAQEALDKLIQTKQLDMDISTLNINDMTTIDALLDTHRHSQLITQISPMTGVVLKPAKDDGDSVVAELQLNKTVKKDDALLSIGDMNGISLNVNISEVDINHIESGLPAIVTSVAFPGETLKGTVTSVGSQAVTVNAGLPQFISKVTVDQLTPSQQKNIRVGMSAKVEIIIDEPPEVVVPIEAVTQENGRAVVRVKRDGEIKTVAVETGETNQNSVIILKGLNSGDEVVIAD